MIYNSLAGSAPFCMAWTEAQHVPPALTPSTHALELLLQDAGDVEAEVGAEGEKAIEEQHGEPVRG